MRSRAVVGVLLFVAAIISAQTPQEALEAFLSEPALRGAWVGVLVETADEAPKVLVAKDADKRFMPASNAKLFTAALALERLGGDFVFRTPLLTDGRQEGTTLVGNLYLRGVGDPSLTLKRLQELAKQVAAQGIRKVTGNLIVDVSAFTDNRWGAGWAWDYLVYGYAPEVWAIALEHNAVTVQVAPANLDGAPAKVTLTPPTDWLSIDNRLQTTATVNEADWNLWREAWERTLHLWGRLPMTARPESVRVSVPHVPYYVGETFRKLLCEVGVSLYGDVRTGVAPVGATVVAETVSAPLRELVRWLNKVSDNLYAEMLLRAVALKERGRGDGEEALNILRDQLRVWGIEPAEVRLVDGSGLSRLNMVTPNALVRLLQVVRHRPWFAAFRDSLPIAGTDGTLTNRFRGTAAEKRLVAKTGFIGGVVTISGYLKRQEGSEWVFSVMVNHFAAPTSQVQSAVDRFLVALVR